LLLLASYTKKSNMNWSSLAREKQILESIRARMESEAGGGEAVAADLRGVLNQLAGGKIAVFVAAPFGVDKSLLQNMSYEPLKRFPSKK
jgi:hypothetical protein